jgi:thymidine kinase
MFSGKSDELIRRLRRASIAINLMQNGGALEVAELNQRIMVFKPSVDNRRGKNSVNSEDGPTFPATSLDHAKDAIRLISEKTLMVAFDEAQFWEEDDLVQTCKEIACSNKVKVIVAGLSLNFKGEKWGGVGTLALEADNTDVLTALCTKCGGPGIYTQRIIEQKEGLGKKVRRPADYNDPVELVGATESYEARCRLHHEVPGRPNG